MINLRFNTSMHSGLLAILVYAMVITNEACIHNRIKKQIKDKNVSRDEAMQKEVYQIIRQWEVDHIRSKGWLPAKRRQYYSSEIVKRYPYCIEPLTRYLEEKGILSPIICAIFESLEPREAEVTVALGEILIDCVRRATHGQPAKCYDAGSALSALVKIGDRHAIHWVVRAFHLINCCHYDYLGESDINELKCRLAVALLLLGDSLRVREAVELLVSYYEYESPEITVDWKEWLERELMLIDIAWNRKTGFARRARTGFLRRGLSWIEWWEKLKDSFYWNEELANEFRRLHGYSALFLSHFGDFSIRRLERKKSKAPTESAEQRR